MWREVTQRDRITRCGRPQRRKDPRDDLTCRGAHLGEFAKGDRKAASFGKPFAIGIHDQWHMCIGGAPKSEQLLEHDVTGCRRCQIITPNHLGDALEIIVDDDREVVCRHAVAPAEYDVVDRSGHRTEYAIGELDRATIGTEPEGWRSSRFPTFGASSGREPPAGTRIRTGRAVRGERRRVDLFADLAPAAEALVDEIPGRQIGDGVVVQIEAVTLADHRSVPVETDRREIA